MIIRPNTFRVRCVLPMTVGSRHSRAQLEVEAKAREVDAGGAHLRERDEEVESLMAQVRPHIETHAS